jgi:hypothetical protein
MAELLDVGGYRLAISVSGADSPPVVCASGLTGDASEWLGSPGRRRRSGLDESF